MCGSFRHSLLYVFNKIKQILLILIIRILSLPITFLAGTRTFSNRIPLVSEQRWPILTSLRPGWTPSHSRSTMKPVKALIQEINLTTQKKRIKYGTKFKNYLWSRAFGVRVSAGKNKVPVSDTSICDPHFFTIKDPLISNLLGASFQASNIRSGPGLGDTISGLS